MPAVRVHCRLVARYTARSLVRRTTDLPGRALQNSPMSTVARSVVDVRAALFVQRPRSVQRSAHELLNRSMGAISRQPRDRPLVERRGCDERLGKVAVQEVIG